MCDPLQRELTGLFVGCDVSPTTATCSFHEGTCTLGAGDEIQLEVEFMDGQWSPLFHRCLAHAVDAFPEPHAVYGVEQALVEATLAPTGACVPETGEYAPDALTLADITIVDHSSADAGRRSALAFERGDD